MESGTVSGLGCLGSRFQIHRENKRATAGQPQAFSTDVDWLPYLPRFEGLA